jgi:hypothetical protein
MTWERYDYVTTMHRTLASALMLHNPIKLIIQIMQVTVELILMTNAIYNLYQNPLLPDYPPISSHHLIMLYTTVPNVKDIKMG